MAQTHSLDLESASTQYASIADASQTGLDLTGDFTFEAWVKFESVASGYVPRIIGKWNSTGSNFGYLFSPVISGGAYVGLSVNISSDGSTQELLSVSGMTINTGVWYHVAVAWTASTSTAEFFLNGASKGTSTGTRTSIYNNTDPFQIGRSSDSAANETFDGLIKDVRVFNDIRTAAEILADARTETVSDANLQAEWNFNNGYTDNTANNNDLTATGSPTFSTDRPWVASTQVSGSTYLETNLQAYWTMDESSDGSGAVSRLDSTANNNDLTDNNTTASGTGKISNGADFEKTNTEYLTIADASQTGLDLTGDMSFSMWVNFESYDGTGTDYVLLGKTDYSGQRSYSIELNIITNNSIGFQTSDDGSASQRGQISWSVSTATWYHIVVAYDASAGTAEVFRNGVSLGTITGLDTSVFNSNAAFQISGANDGGQTYHIDGIIDEVAVYSRALHYGDVLDLYNAGSGITYAGTTIYTLTAASGSYTLTGVAATIARRVTTIAETGSYALTGIDATFKRIYNLTAALGTYTYTGVAATLRRLYNLTASVGSYILTGIAVRIPTFYSSATKNSTSYTPASKNSTSYTAASKNSTNYSEVNKNG